MTDLLTHQWTVDLPSEAATELLARDLAATLRAGDLVTLSGDLGAGKTAFARALIREIAEDPELEVSSPTFTLIQLYDTPTFPIVHADLYRIGHASELDELGWDEAPDGALVLVEWPEKAGETLPADRLDIRFVHAGRSETARRATLTGTGDWSARLRRFSQTGDFLRHAGWQDAAREHVQGDASTRSYARLRRGQNTVILMNSPARTDRTPVRYGKTYSQIAHISQDVKPFVAMARGLAERGFSAPQILKEDLLHGLLLLEDFGTDFIAEDGKPVAERYGVAVDLLAHLHGMELPDTLPVASAINHKIPSFDHGALDIEVELLIEWYMPMIGAPQLSQRNRDHFTALWRSALAPVVKGEQSWLLRDVHSPNLMWLPRREGIKRIGLLDFQDAMIGPPAYDVASLCLDARVSLDQELELQLLTRYVKARRGADAAFDPAGFARAYAVMAAQRNTKLLGLFARLDKRDGKPAYLKHIPRIRAYLDRALAHPTLADLREWFETFVFAIEARVS
ncbi:tRNA (N6-adenosine(37)-N6)-threonylcarbamoyltransferase complex ATPase TsaE [Labrys sp. WJW]|uniref:tRNA (adenosine(37)-N6)-threonylcarbamoyltransferase complex ATPase subunit type 1 TsaE n=1 Tax=Labrys sp. WJW TaxID=1737983 RepID=UPI0008317E29|nr:tRNA (adenosine(37)-N6)-threonylcarbamoyltransferase complex ATPase subunit type 1 TsaE [Labrys sp. WJW]OCC06161.1 tRNA (N6-adenosine(37)-N6)-threonylcarbamoyltransferase complex ATPase TsaE [Labrys sp. WJW]